MHQLRELNIGENCSLNLINNGKQDIPQDHWLSVGKKRRVFQSPLLRNLFDWIPGCLAELGPRNDDEL